MSRKRTGTIRKSGDGFLIAVTIPASLFPVGKLPSPPLKQKAHPRRINIPVPATVDGRIITQANLEQLADVYNQNPTLAIKRAAESGRLPPWIPAEMVPREALQISALIPGSSTETVAAYATRWLEWRDRRGMASIDRYRSALDVHVLPTVIELNVTIGTRPISALSRTDCKALAKSLREKVASGVLRPNTGERYWTIFSAMLATTCDDGDPSMCVRDENPAMGVKGPDGAKRQTRGCLYPDEFLRLVSCETIPLSAQRVIALAVFLQMRAGELSRIRAEDVDLEHEIIHVRRGWDSYRKKEKQPKNGTSRTFDIPPNLLPLLRVMVAERSGKGILTDVVPYRVSERFSEYLDAAGLHRWELRTRTASHIPLTFHGLRATGATWAARTETNVLKLRHMLGHRDQSTTDRYIEASQVLGRNVGDVFPVLPETLLRNRTENRSDDTKTPNAEGGRSLAGREAYPHLEFADRDTSRYSAVDAGRETAQNPILQRAGNDSGTIPSAEPGLHGAAIAATQSALNEAIGTGDVARARRYADALRALLGEAP